jgi:D-glycero-D-manno-heptose 1,7-bisphosphate phosphatase
MSAEDLELLHNQMCDQINFFKGSINKIYYCSHLISENCSCRKPNTGMIKQAIIDFPEINIEESYLIGDSVSDITAGRSMGLISVKVDQEYTLKKWTEELMMVL